MKIRIGSRESALAVEQAKILMGHFERAGTETELITMKTTGDMILDKPLDKIGGKGLFVKELDVALLRGEVDLTVHSFKDMPAQVDERLPIVAASRREDPRDVLILPQGTDSLDALKPIGCSSLRRTIQLKKLYPDIQIAPLRGNVLTRIKRLDDGFYSAIVLALAGLKRLGLGGRVSRVFEPGEILPAACQGILAVQARADFDRRLLDGFNDENAWDASIAERAFIRALDGGCSSPVAAYAEITGDDITLTGLYVDGEGSTIFGTASGNRRNGGVIGEKLAATLKGGAL